MTTQEAYNRLRDILLNNTQLAEADREAICMAINTLNRQTPIKPVSQMKFGKYGTVIGLCPTCAVYRCHMPTPQVLSSCRLLLL